MGYLFHKLGDKKIDFQILMKCKTYKHSLLTQCKVLFLEFYLNFVFFFIFPWRRVLIALSLSLSLCINIYLPSLSLSLFFSLSLSLSLSNTMYILQQLCDLLLQLWSSSPAAARFAKTDFAVLVVEGRVNQLNAINGKVCLFILAKFVE